jgi:hypothetical protein
MTEKKPPYVPTRTCPHRWCKPLHLAPVPFALALIAFDLWHNWRALLMFSFFVFAGVWMPKIVHFKRTPRSRPATAQELIEDLRTSPSALDLEMQDARYEGTGWRMLEVRKGWARAAVGCDLIIVTLCGLAITAMVTNPGEAAKEAESMRMDLSVVISVVAGAAFLFFNLYAHKKATQPRKPKKVWVPAFLRTNV